MTTTLVQPHVGALSVKVPAFFGLDSRPETDEFDVIKE
jgi:hypothetical protein